ncbi:MAG: alpha/beta fold hydrolase [Nanoarchaeota archaeon]|nr:alpha/beta fold hydrolase [Nanoarchaeota archaeon]
MERLEIKNNQNEKLVVEINEPKDIIGPTMLILHALTGKKENKTINFLAKRLPEFGYKTIQFDFSGHGESGGNIEEATVSKQLEDIKSVISQLKIKELIIIGNSFSVITALAFSKEKDVKGLILLGGRAKYLEYIKTLEKINTKYKLIDNIFIDESFVDDYKKYDPIKNISGLDIPILIIHGENDEIIPKEDAQILYNSCPSKKKNLKIIKGADHRYSDIKYKENILREIILFLQKIKINRNI